jgi:hypothetical protein
MPHFILTLSRRGVDKNGVDKKGVERATRNRRVKRAIKEEAIDIIIVYTKDMY